MRCRGLNRCLSRRSGGCSGLGCMCVGVWYWVWVGSGGVRVFWGLWLSCVLSWVGCLVLVIGVGGCYWVVIGECGSCWVFSGGTKLSAICSSWALCGPGGGLVSLACLSWLGGGVLGAGLGLSGFLSMGCIVCMADAFVVLEVACLYAARMYSCSFVVLEVSCIIAKDTSFGVDSLRYSSSMAVIVCWLKE
ncbi:hypothetical protein U1Q18_001714 [Sarracenia purpurea var. burkii]